MQRRVRTRHRDRSFRRPGRTLWRAARSQVTRDRGTTDALRCVSNMRDGSRCAMRHHGVHPSGEVDALLAQSVGRAATAAAAARMRRITASGGQSLVR